MVDALVSNTSDFTVMRVRVSPPAQKRGISHEMPLSFLVQLGYLNGLFEVPHLGHKISVFSA